MTDPTCLFCKIIAGDIASRTVYEDEYAYAFLDISPWHRGHTLVVPKRHVRDLVSGDPVMAEIGPAVDVTSRLLMERLAADGLNLFSATGAPAGQEVFHLHLHLVPRYAAAPGAANLFTPSDATAAELDDVHKQLTGER
jgi:histidine triad (HIT) family protein